MFNDINEVRLMGNITSDPDLRFTPSGTAVLSFGLATNRRYKKGDEWVDEPSFHNIVIWAQKAQSLAPRIKKGTRVHVAGRLQTRSWDGADGKKQYKTEVIADEINLIARYNEGTNAELGAAMPTQSAPADDFGAPEPEAKPAKRGKGEAAEEVEIDPDELPF
jgi:single-strand DNA-binding protein